MSFVYNSLARHYQKNRERALKRIVKGIKTILKKKEKREHGNKQYKNLSENENQKLVGYRKIY